MRRASLRPPDGVVLRFDASIYDIDTFALPPVRPRMPVYLRPAADEALSSWLLRLSTRMGIPPVVLTRNGFGIETKADVWWWRRPTTALLERIGERTSIPAETLARLTFLGWSTARNDEIDERFAPHRFNRHNVHPGGMRPVAVCPHCLAEDETPYIRKEWMIGWTSMCSRHRAVLSTHCPACHAKLLLPGLDSSVIPNVGFCHRCGNTLAGHRSERAREMPLLMQEKLLATKAAGTGAFPEMGALAWETVVATIDLVLGVVWLKGADRSREQLFEEVTRGLKFDPQARLNIDWATNYGMTILLAWLFGEWSRSLQKLWAIMAAPSIDSAVDSIVPVVTEPLQHLRRLCTSVTPETICRQSAIDWLMDLPETGDDLRRRAAKAYHAGLQRKLTVLAMLRDGTDLSKAAAAAKLRPDTIRAWLETGREYGLEAMIGKPIRVRDLPKAQEHEIANWLATIRGRTRGYGAWSAGHVQHEIMQRFGIMLTAASANSLLHSPLPASTPSSVISAPVH